MHVYTQATINQFGCNEINLDLFDITAYSGIICMCVRPCVLACVCACLPECVCPCVHFACVRACVCACVCACMSACVRVCLSVCPSAGSPTPPARPRAHSRTCTAGTHGSAAVSSHNYMCHEYMAHTG